MHEPLPDMEALRLNMETTNPFDWVAVPPTISFIELLDVLREGPEHLDYRTIVRGPYLDRAIFIFGCDCHGPRSYNMHMYFRPHGSDAQPGHHAPPGAPPDLAIATLILGNWHVTFGSKWEIVPLPDGYPSDKR